MPTHPLYEQMKTIADMEAIPEEERLEMRKRAHIGTWYDDNYVPYCGQEEIRCTNPRMTLTTYGHRCKECGNMTGWDGTRLKESPLNFIPLNSPNRYKPKNLETWLSK